MAKSETESLRRVRREVQKLLDIVTECPASFGTPVAIGKCTAFGQVLGLIDAELRKLREAEVTK